jgi:hypothetical protein
MKTPEEMAKEWANNLTRESERFVRSDVEYAFFSGYKAAQVIVEEELQAVQVQRAESPGLGAAEYALKNVLAKMGEV